MMNPSHMRLSGNRNEGFVEEGDTRLETYLRVASVFTPNLQPQPELLPGISHLQKSTEQTK